MGRACFAHRRGDKCRHFFGTPSEGFALRNYTYLQLALGTIIARILVSYIFIKPYYDYKVYSIYEYLTVRFGAPTKNAASAVFLFTRLLASGTRLYAAAIALALAYEMIRGVQPSQKKRFSSTLAQPLPLSF
jgi:solute:Na+ symporter, SSS family